MKRRRIITFVAGVVAMNAVAVACPTEGDSKEDATQALDRLKNRANAPATVNSQISIERMIDPGDDTTRFDQADGGTITGYVVSVAPGGLESCNCHSQDMAKRDTHIVLAAAAVDAKKPHRHVIVEVTPAFRKQLGSTADLRSLVGKWITVTGWMFFDAEHKQNSFNTAPSDSHLIWRATAWEIHPIVSITEATR